MTKDFKSTAKAVDKNLTIPGRTGHDHGYRKTVEQLPDYLKFLPQNNLMTNDHLVFSKKYVSLIKICFFNG